MIGDYNIVFAGLAEQFDDFGTAVQCHPGRWSGNFQVNPVNASLSQAGSL